MSEDVRKMINKIKFINESDMPISDTRHRITEDDIDNCWPYYKSYLVDILNGEYKIDDARDDLYGLIGSKFDRRTKNGI